MRLPGSDCDHLFQTHLKLIVFHRLTDRRPAIPERHLSHSNRAFPNGQDESILLLTRSPCFFPVIQCSAATRENALDYLRSGHRSTSEGNIFAVAARLNHLPIRRDVQVEQVEADAWP